MAVTIDIPGVGNVEAKNAASEATLLEILKAMQSVQKNTAATTKALKDDDGGSGGDGGKAADDNSKAQKKNTSALEAYGKATAIVNAGAVKLISGFGNLATSTTALISELANVGDSVTSAAGALKNIPVVGGALSSVFGAVAGAATQSVGAFQKAAASGATFGGSVNQFAKSASAAGMTLTDFAGLIAANGEAFRLLGGNTAEGAARFATLTKELRKSGATRELNNLGFSTAEVNQGMANYMRSLGQTGRLEGKNNAQLTAGSAKYLKEMDLLAKVTGETRAEQEAARAKLLNDAQFQAKVSSMSTDAGEAFANTVNSLPAGLRDVAKDIMVTGTATTEESQKFSAMMPKSAQMMQKFAAISAEGGTITKEMTQQLHNLAAEEGKVQKKQFQTQGMYNKDLAGTYMNIVQASNIQTDSLKGAAKAQAEAKVATDDQAYELEKSKQALAEFSNEMTMTLANSGLLTTLMTVFGALATFVQTVVVPVFQALAPLISGIATTVSGALIPVFTAVGGVVRDNLIPMFHSVVDFISDNLLPIGVVIASAIIPALIAQATATWAVVAPLLAAALPFIKVGLAVALLVKGFQMMGGSLSTITDSLKLFVGGFESLFSFIKLGFATLINKLSFGKFGGEMMAEAQSELDQQQLKREALATKIVDDMAANRQKNATADEKKAAERDARDKKYAAAKFGAEKKAIDDKVKAETESSSAITDYSSPEAVLKGFATQQKSNLVKVEPKKDEKTVGTPVAKAETVKAELKPPTATSGVEGTKKTIIAEVESKKAEAQKKTDEAVAKTLENPKAADSTDKSTTQESAESLLLTLNTHMAELVRISKENNRISEKQLSVQEGFGGDLFSNAAA